MGAKLHPSVKTYRVYAPSTHSLPVIKCVSGVEGFAEIELQSCSSNLQGLKELSPHYSRIWNSSKTVGDSTTISGSFKRSFSIVSFFHSRLTRFLSYGEIAIYIIGRSSESTITSTPLGEEMEHDNQISFASCTLTKSLDMWPERCWKVDFWALPG
jgi:hypothetical protein